jgi:hypothetical protein
MEESTPSNTHSLVDHSALLVTSRARALRGEAEQLNTVSCVLFLSEKLSLFGHV